MSSRKPQARPMQGAPAVVREPTVPARQLEEERAKFERRSQKVLAILAKKDERIKSLEEEVQALPVRRELEESKQREAELRDKAMDQGEQIEVLVAELASLRQGHAAAQEMNQELTQVKELHRNESARQQAALEGAEKARNDMRTKLREAEEQREEAQFKVAELESEKAVFEDLLETAKRTALQDENELRRLRVAMKSLEEDADREHPSEQRARQLELQMRQMSAELDSLKKENGSLRVSLTKYAAERQRPPLAPKQAEQFRHRDAQPPAEHTRRQSIDSVSAQSVAQEAPMRQLEALVLQQSEEIVDLRSQLVRAGARDREFKENVQFERRSLLNKVRTLEQQVRVASEKGAIHRRNLESTVRVLSGKSDLHRKYAEQADVAGQLAMVKVESDGRLHAMDAELQQLRESLADAHDIMRRQERDLHGFRVSAVYADVPAVSHTVILQRLARQLDEHKVKLAELSEKGGTRQHDPLATAATLVGMPDDDSLPMSQGQQERVFAQFRLRVHGLQVQLEDREEEVAGLEHQIAEHISLQQAVEAEHENKFLETERQHAEQLAVMNRRIVSHVREKHILLEEKASLASDVEQARAAQRLAEERLATLRSEHVERCKSLQRRGEELEVELEGAQAKQRVAEICYEQDKARLGFLEETLAVLQDQHGLAIDDESAALTLDGQAQREHLLADLTQRANRAEANVTAQQRTVAKLEEDLREVRLERSQLAASLERAQHDADEAEAQRQEEALSAQEMRGRLAELQRQLEEAKQHQIRVELQLVDESSAREGAVAERDVLAQKLADLGTAFATDLHDEQRASQENLAAFQADLEATVVDMGNTPVISLLREILASARKHHDVNENPGATSDLRALERMADAVLQSEQARFAVEAKLRGAEWTKEALSARINRLARALARQRQDEARSEASLHALERRYELEGSIRQMQHERLRKLEADRAATAEKLLVRASAQLRAQTQRCRSLERLAKTHDLALDSCVDVDVEDAEADLLSEVHASSERILQLESELAESSLRLEHYKTNTDGEGEKQKAFVERERKLAEGFKMEASILRDQLHESKREMVNLAFEYETKLMVHESAPALQEMGNPAELRMRMLEQAKEINELHARVAELQEENSFVREVEPSSTGADVSVRRDATRGSIADAQSEEPKDAPSSKTPHETSKLEVLAEETAQILLEQKDKQIKRLRAEADILTRRLADAARANKSLSAANSSVVATLQKFQRRLEKRGPAATASADGIAERLQSFLGLLQGVELEQAVRRINVVLDRYDRERERQRMAEQQEMARLRQEVHSLHERLSKDEEVNKEQLRAAESSQSVSKAECASLRSRLETLQSERDDLHAQVVRLEERLRRTKVQSGQVEALQNELVALRERELSLAQSKEDALSALREEAEQERSALQEQIEDLESGATVNEVRASERKRAQARIKALERRVNEHKGSTDRLKEQLGALKKTWQSPEAVAKLRADLATSRAEIRKYRADAARKRDMLQAAAEKATEEKGAEDDLRRRAQRLEAQARAAQTEARNKENLAQASRQSSERAKSELNEAVKELEELREKVRSLSRERTALRSRIDMLKQEQQQHQQMREQQMREQQLRQPNEAGLFSDARAAAQTVASRDVEKELSAKLDRWRKRASAAENQLETYKRKLASLEEDHKEAQRQTSSAKDSIAQLKAKARAAERESQALEARAVKMEELAEANHRETVEVERALHATLLRVSDEALEIRRKCYVPDASASSEVDGAAGTDANAVAKMLELSPEDVRDLFGAEARCSDPVASAAFQSLRNAVQRHKTFVNHIFTTRGSLPSRLSQSELRRLVQSTCALWRSSGSLLRKLGFGGRSHSFERLDAEMGSEMRQPKIFSPHCGRRFTCGFCECLECAVICSLLFVVITLVLVIRQNVCWTGEDELQLYLDLEDSNGALELFPSGGQPPVPLLHAHSHNDYQQAVPVKLALSAGFCSIEADVFLRSGRLFTGHVQPTSNDLEDQYLRPLVNLAKKNPARPGPINPLASRLGVCEQQTLMIDMKSSSLETWDALETILARVNKESGFRVFECYDQAGMPLPAPEVKRSFLSPVQVIISGISPSLLPELAARLLQRPTHCTRLDGRIDPEHPAPSDASLIRTLGMMSSVWHESFAENLEGTVAAIHAAVPHVKVRFWDTPETPDAWKMLLDAGGSVEGRLPVCGDATMALVRAKVAGPISTRSLVAEEGSEGSQEDTMKADTAHRWPGTRNKIFVLLCASLIPSGAHYMKHALGPLKVYFVGSDTGSPGAGGIVSHAQFGAFLAATSWPNLVMPFLTGLLVDEKGHEYSAVLFTSVALLGHVMFAIFLMPNLMSFPLALAGRVLYGFGEGGTGIVQGAIVGTWFEGNTLAFSIGFTESVHYLANWLGKALPAELARLQGGFRGAVWLGSAFLFGSVLVAIIYYIFAHAERPFRFALNQQPGDLEERRGLVAVDASESRSRSSDSSTASPHQRSRAPSGVSYYGAMLLPGIDQEAAEAAQDATPRNNHLLHHQEVEERHVKYYLALHLNRVRLLPLSYWVLGLMHMVYSNLHNLFGGISADFIRSATEMDTVQAGFIASIDSLLPVFLAPLVGIFVDKYGGRLYICLFASTSAIFAFYIFLSDTVTPEWAILAMILLSVGTSTTPTLVKSAVPIVVSPDSLGTAFGIYSVFESFGGGIGHVVFGYIRDISASYTTDLQALLMLACLSLFLNVAAFVRAPKLNAASFH
ncbi:Major facilitator superfamily domain-containing protein 1 [Hondaea fermentalgiana]|uniref:Lysosomal dipeptide transporter MFSD1 n=1 Tax=Hondaea fermentalgiana TaxID=2315210 RepID=A0A2R5G9I6_9STRA|nr:Major facilitator superfamily domain-containing protein 1 [Hondaea fermentalgiana]|eukprot:GBG27697.1 Major facilitator superfamily domain-containing protein 1 [Hondaea fermentalgiana]